MTPVEVTLGVLRHRDGADDDTTARRIVAALDGHQLLARNTPSATTAPAKPAGAKTKSAITYCRWHPSVKEPCLIPHDQEQR